MEKFYRLAGGDIVREYDVLQAFKIINGISPEKVPELYSKFLQGLENSGYAILHHYTVKELVVLHRSAMAMMLYRDQHNCTLAEAKAAVDKMREGV